MKRYIADQAVMLVAGIVIMICTKDTYSSGHTLRYTYTGDGLVHSIADDNGTADGADDLVYSYTYDTLGNILSVKQGDASAKLSTYLSIGSYEYSNNSWRDLLTKYNGGVITCEGQTYNAQTNTVTGDPVSGNPISLSFSVCFTIISPTGNNSPFANGVLQLY